MELQGDVNLKPVCPMRIHKSDSSVQRLTEALSV